MNTAEANPKINHHRCLAEKFVWDQVVNQNNLEHFLSIVTISRWKLIWKFTTKFSKNKLPAWLSSLGKGLSYGSESGSQPRSDKILKKVQNADRDSRLTERSLSLKCITFGIWMFRNETFFRRFLNCLGFSVPVRRSTRTVSGNDRNR